MKKMPACLSHEERGSTPLPRSIWVTWEHQRRNEGLADALQIPLFEFDFQCGRLKRYALALRRTLETFRQVRPEIIFVQNPSLVLTLTALAYGCFTGARVIVDAHNAALLPLGSSASGWRAWPYRLTARLAHMTVVSNEELASIVRARGGRAHALPDRLPVLPPVTIPRPLAGEHNVLFICTYAPDEPYLEVIAASKLLPASTVVYITGNPKHRSQMLKAIAPANVVFTGYLPEAEYVSMLRSVDVVVDLTTREDCLVCGAYEAVAAGKPIVLSDTAALRKYFREGVCFTNNSAEDIARAVREATGNQEALRHDVERLRVQLQNGWNIQFAALRRALATRVGASAYDSEPRRS